MQPTQRVVKFHALNVLGIFINCKAEVELIGLDGEVHVQKCRVFDVVDTIRPGKRVRWPKSIIESFIIRELQENTKIEEYSGGLPEVFTEAF